jgi:hypothetical protein
MNGAGRPCSACSKAGAASSTTTSTTSSTTTTTSSSNQQVRVPELKRKTGQGFETNHQFGDWMHHHRHRHHGQGGDDGGGTQQSQQSNEGENGMDAATRSCSVQCLSANNEWLLLQRHVARMAIG